MKDAAFKQQRHAGPVRNTARLPLASLVRVLLWLGHFVADDAANRRASRCAQKAAANYVARDSTYDRTSGGTLVLCGHPGTATQSKQNCCRNYTD
jgi:hypothetical protein